MYKLIPIKTIGDIKKVGVFKFFVKDLEDIFIEYYKIDDRTIIGVFPNFEVHRYLIEYISRNNLFNNEEIQKDPVGYKILRILFGKKPKKLPEKVIWKPRTIYKKLKYPNDLVPIDFSKLKNSEHILYDIFKQKRFLNPNRVLTKEAFQTLKSNFLK